MQHYAVLWAAHIRLMHIHPGLITRAVSALVLGAIGGASAAAQTDAAREAHTRLSTLYIAIERGDSATVGSVLDHDLLWIIGANGGVVTRAQLVAATANPTPATFTIDSLHAQYVGSTLVVDYIRRDRWPFGDSTFTTTWRALAVFAHGGANWRLMRHSLSWLAQPVHAVPLDSTALQAFVGHYRVGPGYIDNVHWEGGHLVATASGQVHGAQLVPVSESAFSPDGLGAVLVFERDAHGRVTAYVQAYPDGRIVRAPRLP